MGRCNIITCKMVEKEANKTLRNNKKTKEELYNLLYITEKQLNKCNECRMNYSGKQIEETRGKVGILYADLYYRQFY